MKLHCFHCNQPFSISAEQLGGEVLCPHCKEKIRLPDAESYREEERKAATPASGSWLGNSVSGLISVVLHMGLLLMLAMVTCDYRAGGGGEGEEVLIGELPSVDLNDSESEELDAETADPQADDSSQMDESLEVPTPMDATDGEFSVDVDISAFAPSGAASGGGSAGIAAISEGGGSLGEGASFMGVHAKGTRFCIIADRSGSMEGAKLRYVKEEILETLSTMGSRGRFQLIFFNSSDLPYPQSGWRNPRRERTDVANWLQTVTAGGGTYPTPAFRVAFDLSPPPDAIFFMTDGQFPEQVVNEVAALNRQSGRRVQIHTISFMDISAEPLMRQIANDSGGKYRHVSGF